MWLATLACLLMSSPSTGLLDSIKAHEGYRSTAYQDTKGIWTIGYGTNLQTLKIDEPTACEWLVARTAEAAVWASKYPWLATLDPARQDVVVEMIYNLGPTRFSKFKKLHAACAAGDFEAATKEMVSSDWHSDVGVRAEHLEKQMRSGVRWNERGRSA
jgi:lysozyme